MLSESDMENKIAINFLRDYSEFGSRSHLLAVNAIKQSFPLLTDIDDKKILAVKAFEEFISGIEDLGAICIAVRHRDEGLGIVYAFLTYQSRKPFAPKTSLKTIFQLCQAGNGLVDALHLPTLETVLAGMPELRTTLAPTFYTEANKLLAEAASVYLQEDSAFIRAYNKTKHGFVVVKNCNTFLVNSPFILQDTSWIVDVNPEYDASKPSTAKVVELFEVKTDLISAIFARLAPIRGAIITICELTAMLLERGIITSADSKV